MSELDAVAVAGWELLAGFEAGADGAVVAGAVEGFSGVASAGVLGEAAVVSVVFDFLLRLLFFDVSSGAAVAVEFAPVSSFVAFLLFRDFFAGAVDCGLLASAALVAELSSAAALSFFAFFFDFLVVALLLSLFVACAWAIAGTRASVHRRKKIVIQSVVFLPT